MHDIKALEQEWVKYKKKKRNFYLLIAIVCVAVCMLIVTFFTNFNFLKESNSNFTHHKLQNNDTLKRKSSAKNIVEENSTKKERVVEYIKPKTKVYNEEQKKEKLPKLPIVNAIPILDEKPKYKKIYNHKKRVPKKVNTEIKVAKKPHKKVYLNIIKSSDKSAYEDVQKRFYKSHNIEDSLFLARNYYKKNEYNKSKYWAIQTTKVDKYSEEGWLILVKSKMKLGQKQEAKSMLMRYIKQSNSLAAKRLLSKLD